MIPELFNHLPPNFGIVIVFVAVIVWGLFVTVNCLKD